MSLSSETLLLKKKRVINTERTRSPMFYLLIKKVLDKNADFRKKILPIEISFNFCPKNFHLDQSLKNRL